MIEIKTSGLQEGFGRVAGFEPAGLPDFQSGQ
jgi:hypothetical protein